MQNIQSITQALQKSKENYNAKCVEQERLKKEGATQREVEKVALLHLTLIVLLIVLHVHLVLISGMLRRG